MMHFTTQNKWRFRVIIHWLFSTDTPAINHINLGRSNLWCSFYAKAARLGLNEDNHKITTFSRARSLSIQSDSCNEDDLTKIPLNGFGEIEHIQVGNNCFRNIKNLILEGIQSLSRVEIGSNSFTKQTNGRSSDPSKYFSVTDCPHFETLTVGTYSFSDYSSFNATSIF